MSFEVVVHQTIWICQKGFSSGMKPFPGIWKHTILCNKDVFFSLLFSCNNDDHLGQTFHRFAIVCTAGIQQVRILVFDNYKRCPVPLSIDLFFNFSLIDFWGVDYFPNSVQLTRLKRCLQVNQAAFFKGRVNKYGTQP